MKEHLIATSGINENHIEVAEQTNGTGAWAWPDDGNIIIPNGITSIMDSMFCDREDIKSIAIPDSVTSIGYYAFSRCDKLTFVTIPNSVTSIGELAFRGGKEAKFIVPYKAMKEHLISTSGIDENHIEVAEENNGTGAWAWPDDGNITIPDNVTSISDNMFKGRTDIKSITISSNVISIGNHAFDGCKDATFIVPYKAMKEHLISTFYIDANQIEVTGSTSGTGAFAWPDEGNIIIPNGITSISNNMFFERKDIKTVFIPDSITSIGKDAFYKCEGLTSVTIPDNVTSISTGAFCGCEKLASITIPDSVTSIGDCAFWGCKELTSVIIHNSITSIGKEAFDGCIKLNEMCLRIKAVSN